ncbi:uncharacterized protein PFL1_06789 [Pseudozyma flocculosa PF-1]|uniref:Related to enoyl-[acyl-carrier-protein] reductase 1 n=2 Tax=Pseudozyma flocculosa TaxID=84751 RepID=A0A5C3FF94_9BASI|nr:uncharacterized protein PFL1_06789 [Pseudozyma flocculosa PF-1]EPQ25652.1 hypothetical protein PFL1_06789 [Pseudozyma flocculosa PF-1]SPO42059.1 related to enoyl-[acyl-carrier-protein] reductase 1 [Pseudozyma flocculosa]
MTTQTQPRYTAPLRGTRTLVIGGTSGIGFGVASALIEEGGSVHVASSSSAKVDDAVRRLSSPATQYNADASRVTGSTVSLSGPQMEASLSALFQEVGGQIDHLVFTSGDALAIKPLREWSYDDLVRVGDVRYFGAFLAIKTAIVGGHLKRGGSITLTSGSIAEQPRPDWTAVAGFAEGLVGLTRQFALDLAQHGVRVNLVMPGVVKTELWDPMPQDVRDHVLAEAAEATLTKKCAEVQDLVHAYLYLMKDTNITGQVIRSDGGSALVP